MTRFYGIYKSPAGINKAEALRTAQIALLRGMHKVSSTTNRELKREDRLAASKIKIDSAMLKPFKVDKTAPFAHPFYWSPFILTGNWK
jgi:CHAT domain-containing protein